MKVTQSVSLKVLRVEDLEGNQLSKARLSAPMAAVTRAWRAALSDIFSRVTHLEKVKGRKRLPDKQEWEVIRSYETSLKEFQSQFVTAKVAKAMSRDEKEVREALASRKHVLNKEASTIRKELKLGARQFDSFHALKIHSKDHPVPELPQDVFRYHQIFRFSNEALEDEPCLDLPDNLKPTGEELTHRDLNRLLHGRMMEQGLTSYVYNTAVNGGIAKLFNSEILYAILRGERRFPVFDRPDISIGAKDYSVLLEERIRSRDERRFLNPVMRLPPLIQGGEPLKVICHSPKREKRNKVTEIISKLQDGEWNCQEMRIRRRRRPGADWEWFIDIPYKKEVKDQTTKDLVAAVHRGVANALTVSVYDGKKIKHYHKDGVSLVKGKEQYRARRARLQNQLRRAPREHVKARRCVGFRNLANKEKAFVSKEINRIGNWLCEALKQDGGLPEQVLVEDFNTFISDVLFDDKTKYAGAFVRTFPMAKLKLVLTQKLQALGITVIEVPAAYISQKCPACDHISEGNVVRYPSANLRSLRKLHDDLNRNTTRLDGRFKCESCGLVGTLDETAVDNMLLEGVYSLGQKKRYNTIRNALQKFAKTINIAKLEQ